MLYFLDIEMPRLTVQRPGSLPRDEGRSLFSFTGVWAYAIRASEFTIGLLLKPLPRRLAECIGRLSAIKTALNAIGWTRRGATTVDWSD